MSGSTIVWIIVAVIVVGAIVAFVMSRSGARRAEAERVKATEIREEASQHDRRLLGRLVRLLSRDARPQPVAVPGQARAAARDGLRPDGISDRFRVQQEEGNHADGDVPAVP